MSEPVNKKQKTEEGPFTVFDVYYKHGECGITIYETKEKLYRAMEKYIDEYRDCERLWTDDEIKQVKKEIEEKNLEKACECMTILGEKCVNGEYGYGWVYIHSGGTSLAGDCRSPFDDEDDDEYEDDQP